MADPHGKASRLETIFPVFAFDLIGLLNSNAHSDASCAKNDRIASMEHEYSKTILTNMCMLYKKNGSFLVQFREKHDWPGINFPGGHVERYETLEESCIREMKEETGLDVHGLEQCGVYEWNVPQENLRHLCVLYRSDDFQGELTSSKEGKMFFIYEKDIPNYPQSTDFSKVLAVMKKGLRF